MPVLSIWVTLPQTLSCSSGRAEVWHCIWPNLNFSQKYTIYSPTLLSDIKSVLTPNVTCESPVTLLLAALLLTQWGGATCNSVRDIPQFWSHGLVSHTWMPNRKTHTENFWYRYVYHYTPALGTHLFLVMFLWTSSVNCCPSVKLIGLQTPVERSQGHRPCANNLTDFTSRFSI